MQKVRDLRTLSPTWNVSINSLPSRLREVKRFYDFKTQKGLRYNKVMNPSKHSRMDAEMKETAEAPDNTVIIYDHL